MVRLILETPANLPWQKPLTVLAILDVNVDFNSNFTYWDWLKADYFKQERLTRINETGIKWTCSEVQAHYRRFTSSERKLSGKCVESLLPKDCVIRHIYQMQLLCEYDYALS